jgi:hypothetical protein
MTLIHFMTLYYILKERAKTFEQLSCHSNQLKQSILVQVLYHDKDNAVLRSHGNNNFQ